MPRCAWWATRSATGGAFDLPDRLGYNWRMAHRLKIDAIIQARMGSTRLRGKVLMRLGGDSVLAQVVHRCRRAAELDGIVVATTTHAADDAIVAECARLEVPAMRGPAEDVLARYAAAARELGSDALVRITSDCPLIDAGVIDSMVGEYRRLHAAGTPCDYLSNALERTFPRGLDVEIVRAGALLQAAQEARAPHEREHVTPFLYERPGRYTLRSWRAPLDAAEQRWTLDTPEDLRLLTLIFDALGEAAATAPWTDVLQLVRSHPQWAEINRHVVQKSVTG